MVKTIICSAILMLILYWFRVFLYAVLDWSFVSGAILCLAIIAGSIALAKVIDHSRLGRQSAPQPMPSYSPQTDPWLHSLRVSGVRRQGPIHTRPVADLGPIEPARFLHKPGSDQT